MTVVWVVAWLACGTPDVDRWNGWLVLLLVVLLLDAMDAFGRQT